MLSLGSHGTTVRNIKLDVEMAILSSDITNSTDSKRMRGSVMNFLPRKGYGFIQDEDGAKVFVHFSDIRSKDYRTLVQGEEVEFVRIRSDKGYQAVDVVRLNPPITTDTPPIVGNKKTW